MSGAQSPIGAGAFLRIGRWVDPEQPVLYAEFYIGHHQPTRVIARAASTDPLDEDYFRWLMSSAAAFHPSIEFKETS